MIIHSPWINIVNWATRLLAGAILLQTLYFKFSAAPESVYIFDKVGLGASGRIGTGIVELIVVILLFVPHFTWLGAALALGVMSGAIFSHLTVLGIEVQKDGGELFYLAVTVWVSCLVILWLHRDEIPYLKYVPWIGSTLVKWQQQ